jgi:hypothetical protein
MATNRLHKALIDVAPVVGVAVGRKDNKSTWRVDFDDNATQEQKDAAAAVIAAFDINAPTADDVRTEAQRRIMVLVGAASLDGCIIKQLNANMRANELNDIRHGREWTEAEAAEAAALRGLANQIKAIRAASNVLEPAPPADFTADTHWP